MPNLFGIFQINVLLTDAFWLYQPFEISQFGFTYFDSVHPVTLLYRAEIGDSFMSYESDFCDKLFSFDIFFFVSVTRLYSLMGLLNGFES